MESYQFIKQIGHGSYGDVWLVKCSKTRKKYVLKRIELQWTTKREQRAAYLEAKLLSTIKHPHIVTYLDSFYDSKGSLFIVMGYYECGDLYTYIKNQNGVHFQEKEVIRWFVQICMALKCLHDKNIFHRNLKTRNIFLTKNKLIKVGDVGIAQTLTSTKDIATTLIGIPCYSSPEVFVGKAYTQKSDVWALGCCIYEIATLKQAFNTEDINNLVQKVITKKLSTFPDTYSVELAVIISSMLNCDAEKRPCVTELLLHVYVRKHIVLFLKDNPERFLSFSNAKIKPSSSKSNCFETRSINNGTKLAKEKEFNSEDISDFFTTVPDINGNGDGNDNSQQREITQDALATECEQDTSNSKNITSDTSSNYSGDSDKKAEIETFWCLYKNYADNTNPKEEILKYRSISQPSSISSMNTQKTRSEHSFQILNDLRSTIRNTRLKNFECYSSGSIRNQNVPSKYFGEVNLPKSAEVPSCAKITSKISKRTAASAKNHIKTASSKDSHDDTISLPQLKKNETKNIIFPKDSSKIALPLLTKSEVLYFEDSTKTHIPHDVYDQNIDKVLLKTIMECNYF